MVRTRRTRSCARLIPSLQFSRSADWRQMSSTWMPSAPMNVTSLVQRHAPGPFRAEQLGDDPLGRCAGFPVELAGDPYGDNVRRPVPDLDGELGRSVPLVEDHDGTNLLVWFDCLACARAITGLPR